MIRRKSPAEPVRAAGVLQLRRNAAPFLRHALSSSARSACLTQASLGLTWADSGGATEYYAVSDYTRSVSDRMLCSAPPATGPDRGPRTMRRGRGGAGRRNAVRHCQPQTLFADSQQTHWRARPELNIGLHRMCSHVVWAAKVGHT